MTHVTCRLTAKNRNELRNPTLVNRVWATFYSVSPVLLLLSNAMLSGPRSHHIIGIYCKMCIALTHSLIKTVQLETTHVKDTAKESSSAVYIRPDIALKWPWLYATFLIYIHCESKKQDTKLLPITSPNINRFLKFLHC